MPTWKSAKHGGDEFDAMSFGELLAEMMGQFTDYDEFHDLQAFMNEREAREWVRARAHRED